MDEYDIRFQLKRLGWALCAALAVPMAAALLLSAFFGQALAGKSWGAWALNWGAYLCALPAVWRCLWGTEVRRSPRAALDLRQFFEVFAAGYALLFAGNILGRLLMGALEALAGRTIPDVLQQAVDGSGLGSVLLFAVVLGPVVEELLFRGLLQDRLAVFGPRWALFGTAAAFALYHLNLYQLFYAFGAGLALGWLKERTGDLRYCIAAHIGINFLGSVPPLVLAGLPPMEDGTDPYAVWGLCLLGLTCLGAVTLLERWPALRQQLPPGPAGLGRQALRTPPVLLALALAAGLTVLNML